MTTGSFAAVVLMTRSASIRAWPSRSNGTARPPHRAAADSDFSALRLVTRIVPGLSPLRCCKVVSPIFPAPMTSTVLSAKESKTSRATSTATLATDSFPWSMPVWARTALPTRKRRLEHVVEDRADRLARAGRVIGVADLAEDLSLAQHQALEARRDAEQMADDPLIRDS